MNNKKMIAVSFLSIKQAINFFRSQLDDNEYMQLIKWDDGYYYVENTKTQTSNDKILYTWENNKIFKH